MPKVAIILATFNGAKFLQEQINSIVHQTHEDWHIFYRDDGSTDKTIDILTSIPYTNKVTQLSPDNLSGGSAARNFFLSLFQIDVEKYDFVCFCDQDDIWAPGKLTHAINSIVENNSDCYSSDLIAFDNFKRKAWYLAKSSSEKKYDYIFQGASAGCTYMLNRVAAELVKRKIGLNFSQFPTNRSHDWLIYAICRSYDLSWYQDRTAHIFYRQHDKNVMGALPSIKGLFFRFTMARSGWYRTHILSLRDYLSGKEAEVIVLDRISRLKLRDRLWLARRCFDFRRTRRDCFLLGLLILCGLF